MTKATRLRGAIVAVCFLAATACSSDGDAGDSDRVEIHAEIESGDVFGVGVFTAAGAGFCPTGSIVPSRVDPVEQTDGRQSFLQVQYECDDDSGIFFIETVLDLPYDSVDNPAEGAVGDEAAWSLEKGFGDYADTSGSGEVTVKIDSGFYVFDGTLSID